MKTLFNIVTYNHRLYPALTEEKDRKIIERLVEKLQFLEVEILAELAGTINISPSGNVFIHNYPPALHRKINLI